MRSHGRLRQVVSGSTALGALVCALSAAAGQPGAATPRVVAAEVLGTFALDDRARTGADATRFDPGWGVRVRFGYELGGSRLRLSPRLSVGYLSFRNQDEPELYHGHDVNHLALTVGTSLIYRMDRIEPFVMADVGGTLYTSAGGEEGLLPGVIAVVGAGLGLRLGRGLLAGPVVAVEHPRFGGLPGFSGEPERGAFTLGLFVSLGQSAR